MVVYHDPAGTRWAGQGTHRYRLVAPLVARSGITAASGRAGQGSEGKEVGRPLAKMDQMMEGTSAAIPTPAGRYYHRHYNYDVNTPLNRDFFLIELI